MKPEIRELEYRKFLGLDTRADKSLVPMQNQIIANNMVLEKGVLKSRKGSMVWGTLDHSTILGQLHQMETFDIGTDEYVIMHKGTGVYYGLKDDTSYTQMLDLSGSPVVLGDTESELAPWGYSAGSNGEMLYKVLVKQQAQCKVLEFDNGSWIGRGTGIDTSGLRISVSDGGFGNSIAGEYRLRVVARRKTSGGRINESAPTGKTSSADDASYQQISVPSGGGLINAVITDSSPDEQTTHYGIHVTKVLNLVDGSDYSSNANDPTVYYEVAEILKSELGDTIAIPTDISDLGLIAPNLIGHLPLVGHLISVVGGNLTFFAGVADNPNRIYHSGTSGFFYHSELYDPFTYHSGGDDDGQLIIGLGAVQDHLLVLKEAKTGIIPNRSLQSNVVWRDYRLGAKHRNSFANFSEDEIIILNQDGIFRIFNGIRYDREAQALEATFGFSENIRTLSETIDSSTLDFVYVDERMHILYGPKENRNVLVFHPRDFYGWTLWEDCEMNIPLKAVNNSVWLYEKDGVLYEQNVNIINPELNKTDNIVIDGTFYTDRNGPHSDGVSSGERYYWEVEFALMTSQITRKNKALIKIVGVDGEFKKPDVDALEIMKSRFDVDFGRQLTPFTPVLPDPTDTANADIKWFQVNGGDEPIVGNYIKLALRGTGKAIIRGIYWGYIEKESGNLGWSQPVYEPQDYVQANYLSLDALEEERVDEIMVANDAGDENRDETEYIEYTREGI